LALPFGKKHLGSRRKLRPDLFVGAFIGKIAVAIAAAAAMDVQLSDAALPLRSGTGA